MQPALQADCKRTIVESLSRLSESCRKKTVLLLYGSLDPPYPTFITRYKPSSIPDDVLSVFKSDSRKHFRTDSNQSNEDTTALLTARVAREKCENETADAAMFHLCIGVSWRRCRFRLTSHFSHQKCSLLIMSLFTLNRIRVCYYLSAYLGLVTFMDRGIYATVHLSLCSGVQHVYHRTCQKNMVKSIQRSALPRTHRHLLP